MKAQSEDMRTFVTVIDCGSITAAAEQLSLTVSAVSRTLSRLEQKLGITLLNRTTRRMQLTEEGEFFLADARHILRQIEAMEERMALRQQNPAGRLRINAATPFMLHAIVPHVAEFRRCYPLIQLQLNTDELNIDLLEHSTDLAIRIGALTDSSLHARTLGSSRLDLVASPAYLDTHGTPDSLASLRSHSLLGFTQPESLNIWPLTLPSGESLCITPTLYASSGETLRQLALHGQGIACLAHFMTAEDFQQGRLVRVMPDQLSPRKQIISAVYYRNSQLALRIQCFLDFIQERLRATLDEVDSSLGNLRVQP